jgi:hypothetical protein
MPDPQNALGEMLAEIEGIGNDPVLRLDANFNGRNRAIDRLEFNVLDRLDGLPVAGAFGETVHIREQAQSLKHRLEGLNDGLFQRLRDRIKAQAIRGNAFRDLLGEHAGSEALASDRTDEPGYDNLDAFLNGLFSAEPLPPEMKAPEPEMVFYQKTPGRVILELVGKAELCGTDVFYDLGSGLGQVPLMVNLLAGIATKGVEYEPAYCAYAERRAGELGLADVTFLNADVRAADLSDGTVFFLYTPFTGRMLEEVLDKLRGLSERRAIRLFTYGPCTLEIARQDRLQWEGPDPAHPHRLGAFRSL